MKRVVMWFQRHSLWLVGMGLMLASSGVDGAYMARWMPAPLTLLGYVLNTTSDVAGEVLMYWFGRLQLERKGSKKWKASWALLPAETLAIGFSWFFSWRQLRFVLPSIEGDDATWVSWVSAAFVPLMLAAIGYAQALIAGRLEAGDRPVALTEHRVNTTEHQADADEEPVVEPLVATIEDWRAILASLNGQRCSVSASGVQQLLNERGFAPAAESTARRWAKMARAVGG